MSKAKTSSPTCDNCANMSLHLGGDRLMHRRCESMHLHIPDLDNNATCPRHKRLVVKGGSK